MAAAVQRKSQPCAEADFSIESILFEACCTLKTLWKQSENIVMHDDDADIRMKAEKKREVIERMNNSLPYQTVIDKLFGKFSCGRLKETVHCLLEKDTKAVLRQWPQLDPEEKLVACSRLERLFREVRHYEQSWEALLKDERGLQHQLFLAIQHLIAEKYKFHLYVELEHAGSSLNGPKRHEHQHTNIVIENREKGTAYFIELKNRATESNTGNGRKRQAATPTGTRQPDPRSLGPSGRQCYQIIISPHQIDMRCECLANAELVGDLIIRKRIHHHTDKPSLLRFVAIVKV